MHLSVVEPRGQRPFRETDEETGVRVVQRERAGAVVDTDYHRGVIMCYTACREESEMNYALHLTASYRHTNMVGVSFIYRLGKG